MGDSIPGPEKHPPWESQEYNRMPLKIPRICVRI